MRAATASAAAMRSAGVCRRRVALSSARSAWRMPRPEEVEVLRGADARLTTLIPGIKWVSARRLQAFRSKADMHTVGSNDSRVVVMGQGLMVGTLSNTAEDTPAV